MVAVQWKNRNKKITKVTTCHLLGKEMKTIKTKQAPQAIGPYSQAKL